MKGLKHPATIIASIALFVALGSGAALASGLISGKEIVNHSISEKKLTASAVRALHGLRGPAGAQGPKGDTGAQGVQGVQGVQGQIGPSNAISTYDTSGVEVGLSRTTLTSLTLPAGSYVVMAKTIIDNDLASSDFVFCYLHDGTDLDQAATTDNSAAPESTVTLMAPLTTSGSTVDVECYTEITTPITFASYTHLIAIKLGSVTGS